MNFYPESLAEAIPAIAEFLAPLKDWSHRCHEASLAVVQSGILAESRVARGACAGVGSQHSWVVFGMDCYDEKATIIDPTLWSYDDDVEGIWTGTMGDPPLHRPHGTGNIFEWGRPTEPTGKALPLVPREPFSKWTLDFLDLLGPLDMAGWRMLCHAPVEGWPAGEIFAAICDTFEWGEALIPIDILGMTTLRNPGGLYLAGEMVS